MGWDEFIAEHPGMAFHGWDGKPVNMAQWIEIEKRGRHVGDTYIRKGEYVFRVSTILLGTDMSFGQMTPPLIFETMVFVDRRMDQDFGSARYQTLAQARAGHRQAVKAVRRLPFRRRPQLIHKGGKP